MSSLSNPVVIQKVKKGEKSSLTEIDIVLSAFCSNEIDQLSISIRYATQPFSLGGDDDKV